MSSYFKWNNRYKLSRRGKTTSNDDVRMLLTALPKDIPEKTWLEIFQKEDNDFLMYDIREEIVENAMKIIYENYLVRHTPMFTVFCAQEAWLKLVDWHFYRHDPGEDPAAFPPCFIPKRAESWIPDTMPEPSPRDTWHQHSLPVIDCTTEEGPKKWPSADSLDYPVIEEIPKECWFPGNVVTGGAEELGEYEYEASVTTTDEPIPADSEVLQKVTDYSSSEVTSKEPSVLGSAPKLTTPADSLQGAGDSAHHITTKRKMLKSSKSISSKARFSSHKNKVNMSPVAGDSRSVSRVSDCRIRNLRLETQFEVSSEIVESIIEKPKGKK